MTDLTGALQLALDGALNGLAGLPPVTSEVPTDDNGQAVYPFTLLGDDQVTKPGGKGSRLERHEIAIHVCAQSTTKLAVRGLQELVRARLEDGDRLAAAGASFSRPKLLNANTPLLEDGATYVGSQVFLVFVQPD